MQKISFIKDKNMATIIRQSYIDKIALLRLPSSITFPSFAKPISYTRWYVISMTPLLTKNDDDGITHLHLRKFLTEGI